jgi:uncharacterized peroxidase-related enzyme
MPRLQALSENDLPRAQDSFASMRQVYGFVPASVLTMYRRPGLAEAFGALFQAAMTETQLVPLELKWLVAHAASRGAACTYCQADTASNGAHSGLDPRKVDAVWEFETSEVYSDAERAALRVAFASGMVPNAVDDEMFTDLGRHFTEDQILEVVGVLSVFGYLNRWNSTLQTELDAVPLAFATDHLVAQGWEAGEHGVS